MTYLPSEHHNEGYEDSLIDNQPQASRYTATRSRPIRTDSCRNRRGSGISTLSGNRVPHPACWVRHITHIARDEVDVDVSNCLPRCLSYVDANVIAAW